MGSSAVEQKTQTVTCPQLPLAVYREVTAHLRQVAGVEAELIMRAIAHDPEAKFDYYQSQVAALKITYDAQIATADRQRVTEILDYYAQRYRPWEDLEV